MYGKKSVPGDVCRHFGAFLCTFVLFHAEMGEGRGCVLRSFRVVEVVFSDAKGHISRPERIPFAI